MSSKPSYFCPKGHGRMIHDNGEARCLSCGYTRMSNAARHRQLEELKPDILAGLAKDGVAPTLDKFHISNSAWINMRLRWRLGKDGRPLPAKVIPVPEHSLPEHKPAAKVITVSKQPPPGNGHGAAAASAEVAFHPAMSIISIVIHAGELTIRLSPDIMLLPDQDFPQVWSALGLLSLSKYRKEVVV